MYIHKKKFHVTIQSSFIHNRSKLERIQMFTNWWVDNWTVASSNNGLLLNNNKELTADTCNNMNESKTLCWVKKAKHERVDPMWFQLYETLDHAKPANSDRDQISVCLRQRLLGGDQMQRATREVSGVMEMFYITLKWWLLLCIHLSKLIKVSTWNVRIALYVNYSRRNLI